MTAQEIFNAVWKHLVTDNAPKSVRKDGEACQYRGADGAKCAVGILVTDEECEGWDASGNAASDVPLPARLTAHVALLAELQLCHDTANNPQERSKKLRKCAQMFALKIPGEEA